MTSNIEKYNKDELEPPQWLNDIQFFTKVLQKCENEPNIKVQNLQLSPATARGDHYGSIMFRAKIEYTKNAKNAAKTMIIKAMPQAEGHKKDMLQASKAFETEIGMYSTMLPKIESMLKAIGDETVMGPACLYFSVKPEKSVILEDIVPLGYAVIRERDLTLAEAQIAYKKLAKMHAIGYKLVQENPAIFTNYDEGIMTMGNLIESDFMKSGIDLFIEKINTIPTLKKYSPYFVAMKPNLLSNCTASFKEYFRDPQQSAYYALCHGDFHRKNMMFKHNVATKQVEDVKLLDFQLCFVGPTVTDLIYSYIMIINNELRAQFDDILEFYFQHFVEHLKKIGFKGELPKLSELHKQRKRHRAFEMFLLVTFLPMWYDMIAGNSEVEYMMESIEYRRTLYDHKLYLEELEILLPKYLALGYFDN